MSDSPKSNRAGTKENCSMEELLVLLLAAHGGAAPGNNAYKIFAALDEKGHTVNAFRHLFTPLATKAKEILDAHPEVEPLKDGMAMPKKPRQRLNKRKAGDGEAASGEGGKGEGYMVEEAEAGEQRAKKAKTKNEPKTKAELKTKAKPKTKAEPKTKATAKVEVPASSEAKTGVAAKGTGLKAINIDDAESEGEPIGEMEFVED